MNKDSMKHPDLRVIRLENVLDLVAISRASHFAKLDKKSTSYDPSYPRPVKIGRRSVRYVELEIVEWLTARMEARP